MHDTITFITGNQNKAELVAQHLSANIVHKSIDLDEIQSVELDKIIEHKARQAYDLIGSPVLVDDVSLEFFAFGKLPGPFIKWFLQELGPEGLCEMLAGQVDRRAVASVIFGYFDGKTLRKFKGEMRGSIANEPRGENGFGWTSIFIPDGSTKTYSEMTDEEQSEVAMQRFALDELKTALPDINAN